MTTSNRFVCKKWKFISSHNKQTFCLMINLYVFLVQSTRFYFLLFFYSVKCHVSWIEFNLLLMPCQMVVVPQQSKIKIEDDDDEDVEALRLAALKSLRTKDTTHKRPTILQVQKVFPQVTQPSRLPYKGPYKGPIKKNFYHKSQGQRQNGVSF